MSINYKKNVRSSSTVYCQIRVLDTSSFNTNVYSLKSLPESTRKRVETVLKQENATDCPSEIICRNRLMSTLRTYNIMKEINPLDAYSLDILYIEHLKAKKIYEDNYGSGAQFVAEVVDGQKKKYKSFYC